MLTLLLGGALLGGGAFAAWQFLKQLKAAMNSSAGEGPAGDGEEGQSDGAGDEPPEDFSRSEPIEGGEELISKVVAAVKFAMFRRVVVEENPSEVPTDQVNIRPMNGISELDSVIPSVQGYEDDVFFGLAAARQLPVMEFIEQVEREEKIRKALLVLQDCSGSMEQENRIKWAIRLNERLVRKCRDEQAEFVLIPFADSPQAAHHARTSEECDRLQPSIRNILYSDGGTDLDRALGAGMDLIEREKFGEARILLVTDGTQEINVSATKERLRRLNVWLHTVCIAGDNLSLRGVSNQFDLLRC